MMSIAKLRKMLDTRQISAIELTQAYLNKIKEVDIKINSYISVCEESAAGAAKEAQKLIDEGKASFLTGIPISVKDNICTLGIKTTCASKMLEDFVPIYDATVVQKLKAVGAVILGKTNMDEFAMGGSSQTSYFGCVRNPYDTSRVSGGSSGGAAASVSAGLCAGALGSDTGGSVRQPASFCGVTGLKPTYGAVSRYGLIAFASSLDQIGPIAYSAEDCGGILNVIAGYDENDATSAKRTQNSFGGKIGMSLKGMKIGIPKEFFGNGIHDEVKSAVLSAADFYRQAGCELVDVSMPSLEYAVSAYYLISSAEAASNLSRYDGIKFGYRSTNGESYEELVKNTRREGFGEEVKHRILLGNYALSSGYYDAYYNNASKIRTQIKKEYNDIFAQCDCILTPTAPTVAYRIGEFENDPVKMYLADICTVTVNIAGLPAISTTCGYDSAGMPIGMSIVGKAFGEAEIIAAADAFEKQFARQEAVL
ncbi:MAG: Asp-tRNA(Asn)/Glu-tRNA(Gln) amidotransferase subunit GatA [Clostridia bacterium]|nr:Asp-tRNA(Asn)/Glu-tRNA(Gln) amidotransferase subunit GatA [Clostridia bacterium]